VPDRLLRGLTALAKPGYCQKVAVGERLTIVGDIQYAMLAFALHKAKLDTTLTSARLSPESVVCILKELDDKPPMVLMLDLLR
jgi:hypothetical protein